MSWGDLNHKGEANYKAVLKEADVQLIRQAYDSYMRKVALLRQEEGLEAIAAQFGVSAGTVGDIGRRKTWKHLPDTWHGTEPKRQQQTASAIRRGLVGADEATQQKAKHAFALMKRVRHLMEELLGDEDATCAKDTAFEVGMVLSYLDCRVSMEGATLGSAFPGGPNFFYVRNKGR